MFEFLLVDLVQMAEAPVAPAYRWLGRQLGCDVDIDQFLALIDSLLQRRVLRLWHVALDSGERTELVQVPEGLAGQYLAEGALRADYDPFGLSLTLGPAADPGPAPDWELDLDLEGGTFQLTAIPGEMETALAQIGRFFPDLTLLPETRDHTGERARLRGRVQRR